MFLITSLVLDDFMHSQIGDRLYSLHVLAQLELAQEIQLRDREDEQTHLAPALNAQLAEAIAHGTCEAAFGILTNKPHRGQHILDNQWNLGRLVAVVRSLLEFELQRLCDFCQKVDDLFLLLLVDRIVMQSGLFVGCRFLEHSTEVCQRQLDFGAHRPLLHATNVDQKLRDFAVEVEAVQTVDLRSLRQLFIIFERVNWRTSFTCAIAFARACRTEAVSATEA